MRFLHILSWSTAKKIGSRCYFTGKPCKKNHYSERRSSNGDCIECKREQYEENREQALANRAEWRKRNPDYGKNYWEANQEKIKEQKKRYYNDNKPEILDSCKRYRNNNKEKVSKMLKSWHERNPMAGSVAANKRRARILDAGGSFTVREVGDLFLRQRGRCALCPVKLIKTGKDKFHADHIQPISKGGSNFIRNIQLTCPECNRSKGAKDPFEFAKEKGKLF